MYLEYKLYSGHPERSGKGDLEFKTLVRPSLSPDRGGMMLSGARSTISYRRLI